MNKKSLCTDASDKVVIIIDESKLVKNLGNNKSIPVEIIPYSYDYTINKLEKLFPNARIILRRGRSTNSSPDGANIAVTDNGNYIVDIFLDQPLSNPQKIDEQLNEIPSVIGNFVHKIYLNINK